MRIPTTALAVAAVLVAAVTLSACAAEPRPFRTVVPPPAQSSASLPDAPTGAAPSLTTPPLSSSDDATAVACVDGTATASGEGGMYLLDADCARVVIGGNAMTVRITAASTGEVVVRGEGNAVTSGSLESVTVEGQKNSVAGARIGAVTVRGDDNLVSAQEEIGALVVSGSGNTVTAPNVGTKDVSGSGNTVP